MTKTPKWTKEEIKANMLDLTVGPHKEVRGDAWVIRGLFTILANQTPEEQMAGVTVEDNGLGFNGADAEILTSFALQAQMVVDRLSQAPDPALRAQRYSKALSPKQMEIARKKMLKYAGQLAAHANATKPKQVACV